MFESTRRWKFACLVALFSVLPACAPSASPVGPEGAPAAGPGTSVTAPSEGASPSESDAPPSDQPIPEAGEGGPTGKICGARAGDTCKADEYCAYEAGQYCGAADASATCKPRPEMCTRDYRPVCGCDNKTYGNPCSAAAAGQGVLSIGECPPSPDEVPGE